MKYSVRKERSLVIKVVKVFLWGHLFIQQTVMGRMLSIGNTAVNKRDIPCLVKLTF